MDKLEALLAFLSDSRPAPGPASARPAARPPGTRTCPCDACGGSGERYGQCVWCAGTGRVRMPMDAVDRKRIENDWGEITRTVGAIALPVPGDFNKLEDRVRWLPPHARELVHSIYIDRTETVEDLDEGSRVLLAAAMRYLRIKLADIYVPAEIMRWAKDQPRHAQGTGRWANDFAQAKRDKAIIGMVAEGMSQAEVARRLHLHRSTVSRVLAKRQR